MKILVKVKTGAKAEEVEKVGDNEYKVSVKAQPEKGAANEAVRRLMANHFSVSLNSVNIKVGHKTKNKIIEIG